MNDIGPFELNKIYNMDCLQAMKLMPDECVNMVLTDPPYNASNSGIKFGDYTTVKEKWDQDFEPKYFFDIAFNKIKPGGSIIAFCSYHTLGQYLSYKTPQQIIHWEHITALPAVAKVYTPVVEYAVWYTTPRYTFNKRFAKTNVLRNKKAYMVDHKTEHPTQKPSDLIMDLLAVHTQPGDTILDPFIGSGTTAVACIKTDRNFIGFEIDKGYYDIANKRIEAEQAQLRLEL
jgi:site-specific DNA-methyltransferase (adenine-specific)/modification methylase